MTSSPSPRVALFVTCLVDVCRPSVAFAALHLLEASGARVSVVQNQTCCGQIAYNAGDRNSAISIAKHTIKLFDHVDYIVAPSGSCAAMLKLHIPELLKKNPKEEENAKIFAKKCWELTDFLVQVQKFHLQSKPSSSSKEIIAYHDSCSGLRELNIHHQPRLLLEAYHKTPVSPPDNQRCCGFGGSFCVTCSDVSAKMADDKIDAVHNTQAQRLVGGDLGCLLHIAGRMQRKNIPLKVDHIAEILSRSLGPHPHVPTTGIA
jgi:L-lactate dehydrogenase complex protein LldE